MAAHSYALELRWEGNTGRGTADYRGYDRRFRAAIAGKPDLVGSADAAFRGDPAIHNPEDLLVVALSSCHMLAYLALCARRGVCVVDYVDQARGRMVMEHGQGRFDEVVLAPRVTISEASDEALALALHEEAGASCFIARSVSFPVHHRPVIARGTVQQATRAERRDLAVRLANRPGALAELGEVLGRAGVSLEGGGGFVVGEHGIVHFLVGDADRAAAALREAGLDVIGVRDVVVQRLDQETPGQLGKLARAMADAHVNIECIYSDHDHQLVLGVDDREAGQRVADAWQRRS